MTITVRFFLGIEEEFFSFFFGMFVVREDGEYSYNVEEYWY